MPTLVIVLVEEQTPRRNGEPACTRILEIPVRTFDQGAQFGETSDAINFAQKVVTAAEKLK